MTATAGHLFASVALGGAEAAAATARAGCIGVFDVKAATHQIVYIVDAGTVDVEHAGWIDDHLESVLFKDFIALTWGVEGHAVLHATTAAALNKDAQSVAFLHALRIHHATQFLGG